MADDKMAQPTTGQENMSIVESQKIEDAAGHTDCTKRKPTGMQ